MQSTFVFAIIATAVAAVPTPAYAGQPTQDAGSMLSATAPAHCRWASSAISGASASGTLCWKNEWDGRGEKTVFWVSGKVTDSASDGRYAIFRIHFRTKNYFWQTITRDVKKTKGYNAPVTLAVRDQDYTRGLFKDFWLQVCKQGSGHRTCDRHWH